MSTLFVSEALQTASVTGWFRLPDICTAIDVPATDLARRDLIWRALAPGATELIIANGTYWWQIGPDMRRDALARLYSLPQLDRFLQQAPALFMGDATSEPDRFGIALRDLLERKRIKFDDPSASSSAESLRIALSEAAAIYDAVQFASEIPALSEVRLTVSMHRDHPAEHVTLANLKELADAKIKQLQSRLDIRAVLPESYFGYSTQLRAISRFARGQVPQIRPLLVTGVAGAGKSALLSRLMLGWKRSEPDLIVVSLDFDRRQLNAGEPIEIMQELARQIIATMGLRGLPADDPLLNGLATFRSDLSIFKTSSSTGARETHDQQASDIRSVLRQLSSDWATPLRDAQIAVVMDTFEAIDRMADYYRLTSSSPDGPLPENVVVTQIMRLFRDLQNEYLPNMRVIVGGREAPLRDTGQDEWFGEHLRLRGLTATSGANLLKAEAARHSQEMGAVFSNVEKRRRISRLLDGHPLALMAFVRYASHNLSDVDALVADLETSGGFQAEFAQVFLYRRILDRIDDAEVRKIAHPGLMLRRLDSDSIQHILADACLDRGANADDPLTALEASRLFDRLRDQYWLVEPMDGPKNAVRHIPDLRRLMLQGLLAGPAKGDTGATRTKKLDLRHRALEVCRLAATHYLESSDADLRLDAIYYGAFNDPAPIAMTPEFASQLDRHLGSDIDTMPITWRAKVKFTLSRDLSPAEVETLKEADHQEAIRRSYGSAQKTGFTTRSETLSREGKTDPAKPRKSRMRGSHDLSVADLGAEVQISWETGNIAALLSETPSENQGLIWELLRAVAALDEKEQIRFCTPAESSLFDHPIYLAALCALPPSIPAPMTIASNSRQNRTVSECLARVAQLLLNGQFGETVLVLRHCSYLGRKAMPIARNRSAGRIFMAALGGEEQSVLPLNVAYNAMALLAGAPHTLGRVELKKINENNFFYSHIEALYALAETDDLTLSAVERHYRSSGLEPLGNEMIAKLDPLGRDMFTQIYRGLTPELHGPLSAILKRLDFHAGEDVTLAASSRHPMWPEDLRFDDQFIYSAEQALTIVETADRGGVMQTLIHKIGAHESDAFRLEEIHQLITAIYFDPTFVVGPTGLDSKIR